MNSLKQNVCHPEFKLTVLENLIEIKLLLNKNAENLFILTTNSIKNIAIVFTFPSLFQMHSNAHLPVLL